jgi:threonyl-tRNA synthetase
MIARISLGAEEQWNMANRSLEKALKRRKIEYKTIPGEAAFYGPKIDIKLVDAIGRLWQLSTVQVDFNLPAALRPRIRGRRWHAQTAA